MAEPQPLTDAEKARYEWQVWTPGFGEEGQRRLKGASVLVSRCGGVGGLVAYELAQQIKAGGDEVDMLLIIDTAPEDGALRTFRKLATALGKLMGWDDRRMQYQSGNQLWHSDSSFKPVPAHSSALSARVIPPEGGETEFASMRVGYETLPEELRRQVDGKIVVHSFGFSRSLIDPGIGTEIGRDYPPVRHALVRANPRNGRRSLYIGSHAWYIEGMGLDESRMLIAKLLEHTVRADRVYRHRWQVGDLVMWDNRCALHRGRLWDSARYERVMHRTTVAGDGPTADPSYLNNA